jgi:hypothetical protein
MSQSDTDPDCPTRRPARPTVPAWLAAAAAAAGPELAAEADAGDAVAVLIQQPSIVGRMLLTQVGCSSMGAAWMALLTLCGVTRPPARPV